MNELYTLNVIECNERKESTEVKNDNNIYCVHIYIYILKERKNERIIIVKEKNENDCILYIYTYIIYLLNERKIKTHYLIIFFLYFCKKRSTKIF